MATTVGFIEAIGVETDIVFTPDIIAKLERKVSLSSVLERLYEFIAKVNKK